ncbi:hypothetical protein G5S34_04410 [Herbaspirillum frisingense]|uniref:AfaD family invasin n=1 Tax=Herbaspirillum frisingense TaxID=92645 RepID=UPI0016032543|nr:hypothetical protein [Herbaspirillum frisingense]QNB06090.1 hypothetical protein G5S34_04410 [Herbaspirillum frisingense]
MKKIAMMCALSLVTASAMALSTIDTQTITKATGTFVFYAPTVVTASLDAKSIAAGALSDGDNLATVTASETGSTTDGIAIAGDYNASDYTEGTDDMSWTVTGTNSSSNKLKVALSGGGISAQKYGTDHAWFGSNKTSLTLNIRSSGNQTAAADKYDVNFYAAAFLN